MLKNHDQDNQSKKINELTDGEADTKTEGLVSGQDQAQEHMWTNPRVRALVMLIITMFIVLMAGIGVLIYKISQRALDDTTAVTPGQGAQIPTLSLGNGMADQNSATGAKAKTMQLEMNGFTIEKMSTTGKFLTLYVNKGTAREIWIIDISGNKLYKTIKLK